MVQCSKTDSLRRGFGRLLLLVSSLVLFAGAQSPGKSEQGADAGAIQTSAADRGGRDSGVPAPDSPSEPAPSEATPTTYYFISDLHIGGDAGLDKCHFEKELIEFLRKIAEGPQPAELIIVGDAFGMWELTDVPRTSKLARIASTHQDLFAQFRETGRRMKITLLPGNHDYDLACVPSYKTELAQWNIVLEPVVHITREVAGRKIWIEHGNQHDAFNRFPDFGNPYGLPGGYFITTHTVAAAAESAARAESPWLNDVESVYPNEEIPAWIWSNYFYREMTPLLRWCLLPFLLLFSLSVVVFAGRGLERFGILRTRVFHTKLGERFGLKGRLIDWVFWVNGVVISFLLVMAIPGYLLAHDVRSALRRYGVEQSEGLKIQKESKYLAAAEEVFKADPAVAIYVYGHTHAVSMRKVGTRYVINTGTWLKRLEHVRARFHLLPGVFYPSHRLNYFTISGQGKDVRINYAIIPKEPPPGLTWLESLMILGRRPSDGEAIPAETILRVE
jgi:UDP-2,3-diacylglucosamine pyrophosphatase LpxH